MIKSAADRRIDSETGGGSKNVRRRRNGLVAAAVALFALIFATAALSATGGLTQTGCFSEDGTGGECTDGVALSGASSVTVSPDGKNAYGTSNDSDAVTIFDRNTSTGALTQKSGTDGCVSETGTGGACADGKALSGSSSVTVSADGKNVYVATAGAIAIFDRNTSNGTLTQKAGTDGCISESGSSGACVDGVALNGPYSVVVSPDGKNVYVASRFSDAVAIFDRNTSTGVLTEKAPPAGCISKTGTGGNCVFGTEIEGAQSVAISADGKNVYLANYFSDSVAIFDRNTSTGALTQKTNPAGCVSQNGSGGQCGDGAALGGASSVTVSPDDKNVYVTAYLDDAVTVFDRNTSTGALTQKSGTDGCISWNGTGGLCVDGEALNGATSVAISADGKNAYVASAFSKAISIFDRNTSNGTLTQETGIDGCISETGTGGVCTDGAGLDGVQSVSGSPDSKSFYAAAPTPSNALSIFTLDDGKIDGKASAANPQKQKGKNIEVAVKVKANESLDSKAWGKATVKGKDYKFKTVSKPVAADESVTLKLKPEESKDAKKIAKALKKKNGKAKITAQLTDDYGNSFKAKFKVTLKG